MPPGRITSQRRAPLLAANPTSDMAVTRERALQLLDYNQQTGTLIRKPRAGCKVPKLISAKTANGYLQLMLDGRMYYAHRVIWLMQTGAFPVGVIDHLNGVRDDNRWSNLRDVAQITNAQNLYDAHARNRCGMLGVETHHTGRFAARIMRDGAKQWLGLFDTPEQAHAAYLAAKRQVHPDAGINL